MGAHSIVTKTAITCLLSGMCWTWPTMVFGYRPQLMPGWPKTVPTASSFGEMYGASLGDVDGDGTLDVLMGTSVGSLWIWDYQGNLLPGWPQSVPAPCMIQGPPVPGDVNGDTEMDVVAVCRDTFPRDTGCVYVWNSQGQLLGGWPQQFTGIAPTPSLSDLDGDGNPEILVAVESDGAGSLLVFRYDGTSFPGWPQSMNSPGAYVCPSVGDVDNDGHPEVVGLSSDSLYVWKSDGTLLPGWPVGPPPGYIFYTYSPPALADFDGDSDLEIVVPSLTLDPPFDGYIHIYQHTGQSFPDWPHYCVIFPHDTPAIGDVDGDGALEVVISTNDFLLHVLNSDNSMVPGWPFGESGLTGCHTVLGDIDGDGDLEIVAADNTTSPEPSYIGRLHAFNPDGTVAACWSLDPIGCTAWNPAILEDVESNGTLNMVNVSQTTGQVRIWLWDLLAPYDPDRIEWGCFSHDMWHTGCYGFQIPSN